MPDPNRLNVWSDQHDDVTDNVQATGENHDDDVDDKTVKAGQLITANCRHCGRQIKSVVTWSETSQFYVGIPVAGTRTTREGVDVGLGCACGKMTPLRIKWDEIRQWVDTGIRIGALLPQIKRAVATGR